MLVKTWLKSALLLAAGVTVAASFVLVKAPPEPEDNDEARAECSGCDARHGDLVRRRAAVKRLLESDQ